MLLQVYCYPNKGSQLVFKDASDATGNAASALKELSDGAVKTYLMAYRKVLDGVFGHAFNVSWAAAGFTNNSTAVPATHDARLTLLTAARAYLAAHPSYEASLPQPGGTPLAITAAGASRELAEWPRARRATHYRVFIKVEGTDADFRFLDSTDALEFSIKGLTAGATFSTQIVASNDGGDAAPSPTVTKVAGA
jgi:hypothetical protein